MSARLVGREVGKGNRIVIFFQIVQIFGEAEEVTAFLPVETVDPVIIRETGFFQSVSAADEIQEVFHNPETFLQAPVFTDCLNEIEHQHRAHRDGDGFVQLHDIVNMKVVLLPADQGVGTQHVRHAVVSLPDFAFFHDPGKHLLIRNGFRKRAKKALVHQRR